MKLYHKVFFIIINFTNFFVFSQDKLEPIVKDNYCDSLEVVLKKDLKKLEVINLYDFVINDYCTDYKKLDYSVQFLAHKSKFINQKSQLIIDFCYAHALFQNRKYADANNQFEQLLKVLKNLNFKELSFQVRLSYAESLAYTTQKEKSFKLTRNLITEAGKYSLPSLYRLLALNYFNKSEIDSSFYYCRKAHKLAKTLENNYIYQESALSLGYLQYYEGRVDSVLYYFSKAIDPTLKTAPKTKYGAFMNIGTFYFKKRLDVEKAYEYWEKAYHGYVQEKDTLKIGQTLQVLGNYHSIKGQNSLAIKNYNLALSYFKSSGQIFNIEDNYIELSKLYSKQNNFSKAIKNLKTGLLYAKENNNLVKKGIIYNLLASNYSNNKLLKLSEKYFDSTKTIVNRTKYFELLLDYYAEYLKHSKKYNTPTKSFSLYDSLISIKDSLYLYKVSVKNDSLLELFNAKSKELENINLKQENLINTAQISKQKTVRSYLIIIIVLVLTVFIIVYILFALEKKLVKKLYEKNKIIIDKNLALDEANKTKQKLFTIISHDLINPFNAMIGYSNLLDSDYDSFTDTERRNFVGIINKTAKANYKFTQNLLNWSKIQLQNFQLVIKNINCKSIVKDAIEPYLSLANQKNIKTNLLIPDNLKIDADYNVIKVVIGNIFSNALKFSDKDGVIEIKASSLNNKVKISIRDNGIGIKKEELNYLFDITKRRLKLKEINHEKGSGFGLFICKEFLKMHNGTIELKSEFKKGTEVIIVV